MATPKLWNRNFIACGISYFWMNFAFYLLMPTLPVFLAEELKISNSEVGLALSSYTIGVLCVRPFSGYLVDCFSRKRLYFIAFLVFGLFFFGYLWAATLASLMCIRFLQGGFMGLTSVAGNTITIDVIPSERRGEGMGFYGLTINLAMSLAPLIAVGLYARAGFHANVWVSIAVSLLGILSVLFIRYPKRETQKRPPFSLDRFILLTALPAAWAYILIAIPYGMILSFVVLYGREIAVPNPGYFFIYMAIGVGVSRLISGRMVDHGRIHQVAIASTLCLIASFLLFATVHHPLVFFGAGLCLGIGFGTGVPAYQCLFVNVAPHQLRGTATSTYLTSWDIGIGIGLVLGGVIGERLSFSYAYLTGAVLSLVSLLGFVFYAAPHFHRNRVE